MKSPQLGEYSEFHIYGKVVEKKLHRETGQELLLVEVYQGGVYCGVACVPVESYMPMEEAERDRSLPEGAQFGDGEIVGKDGSC